MSEVPRPAPDFGDVMARYIDAMPGVDFNAILARLLSDHPEYADQRKSPHD